MSRGISIYYKLISEDSDKVTYGYSGANINKEYDEKNLLDYDGIIEITINSLKNKTVLEALTDKEINILKECRYEWHQPRLRHGEDSLGFFVLKVVSKIFRKYKGNFQIEIRGSVVY